MPAKSKAYKSTPSRVVAKHPSKLNRPITPNPSKKLSILLRVYRKTISNLKIREDILRRATSKYAIGPTLIWTEDVNDLSIFTSAENYKNYIGFEAPFSNPRSSKYLTKQLQKMRLTKGTILIKESATENAMHIPVHFCAYRIDEMGELVIFDPSWHSADPGIYSTTAFYDSLDAFGVSYKHAEPTRKHHWQSLLPNDVFCQTWTLQWLIQDARSFPLPKTRIEAAKHIAGYIKGFSEIVLQHVDSYIAYLPKYKLEDNNPVDVFKTILAQHVFTKIIYDIF